MANADRSYESYGTYENDVTALRSALAKDLQPLGDALAGAMNAGDLPAMQAALKKISANMPELAGDAGNLSVVLADQFADAYLGAGKEEVANAARYNPQDKGAKGRFTPWNRSREGKTKADRDAFGRKPYAGMTEEENYERVTKSVEWAVRNKKSIQGIAWRKDLGTIDLPWGQTGDLSADHKHGKGLEHIISKHPSDIKGVAEVIAYGSLRPGKEPIKRELWLGRRLAVFVKDKESSSWLLTSYKDD